MDFSFILLLTLFLRYFAEIHAGVGNLWTYQGNAGPEHWRVDYPHCGGVNQSPININTATVEYDEHLQPFVLSDLSKTDNVHTVLENVGGHTVEVEYSSHEMLVSGGGLNGTYKVKQFHFHWGHSDQRGSEHCVNGHHFPMEMHIVLYSAKYANFTVALDKPDGLAVLGFFIEVGAPNPAFNNMLNHFDKVTNKDTHTNIKPFALRSLLPKNLTSFYRYQGSLTTPPCYETVIWTLFTQHIVLSEDQLAKFRHIKRNEVGEMDQYLVDDFRPLQSLHGRKIYTSDRAAIFNSACREHVTWSFILIIPHILRFM